MSTCPGLRLAGCTLLLLSLCVALTGCSGKGRPAVHPYRPANEPTVKGADWSMVEAPDWLSVENPDWLLPEEGAVWRQAEMQAVFMFPSRMARDRLRIFLNGRDVCIDRLVCESLRLVLDKDESCCRFC